MIVETYRETEVKKENQKAVPPLPKKKHTRARKGNKQSHSALTRVTFNFCEECGTALISHRACKECGTYKGREGYVKIKEGEES